MCSSFLTRTLCLRILSFCLSRDVHFSHDFQLQKNQFLQLFRPFSLTARTPIIFPFQRASFAHDIPHQNPLHFPHSSSLSGGSFAATLPNQWPAHFPGYLPFQGKPAGRVSSKKIPLFAKIPYFLVQISACPAWDWGDFRGGVGAEFRDFSSEASLWKGENWGTFGGGLGEKWGKNRTFLSTTCTLRSHILPSNSPHSPLVFFPFRASDRQNLYQKPDDSVQNWSLSGGNHHLHRAGGRGFWGEIGRFPFEKSLWKGLNLGRFGEWK